MSLNKTKVKHVKLNTFQQNTDLLWEKLDAEDSD